MQQLGLRVNNDFVLNQVRVHHEIVYVDKAVSKFWFLRSFSSQHNSKFIAAVVLSLLNENFHSLKSIHKGRAKTGFKIVKRRQLWMVSIENLDFASGGFWYIDG